MSDLVVTAILIGLRLRHGQNLLPVQLQLPLPSWMRPTLQDGHSPPQKRCR